jgi:hypothetical protein
MATATKTKQRSELELATEAEERGDVMASISYKTQILNMGRGQ